MSPSLPFVWVGAEDVARLLDYQSLFAAIETAYVGAPLATPRISLPYQGKTKESGGTLLLMSALLPDALAGVKIITYNPNRKSGTIKYVYIAFDPVSGSLLAVIDGETLSTKRTAAVSVVAARHLAQRHPARIAVIGTGPVARELLRAYGTAYPDAMLCLWGRRRGAAQAIVEHLAAEGIRVVLSPILDDMVRQADIVSCATGSLEPLIKGELLRAGAHVDLIGGFTPAMREADDAVMRRACVVVADNVSALREAGDLCQPVSAGLLREEDVVTFESVLADPAPRGKPGDALTVFKSVGNSIFDLAAARLIVSGI